MARGTREHIRWEGYGSNQMGKMVGGILNIKRKKKKVIPVTAISNDIDSKLKLQLQETSENVLYFFFFVISKCNSNEMFNNQMI